MGQAQSGQNPGFPDQQGQGEKKEVSLISDSDTKLNANLTAMLAGCIGADPACIAAWPVQEKKKKWEPPAPPPRVGRKQRRRGQGAELGSKLPGITPNAKCKLRMLKLERVKDWLLMEEEFVQNQERLRPQEERNEEDRSKVRH